MSAGERRRLSQSQTFVDEQAYMNGMMPLHSIAILTSERADIGDVRVRQLADDIRIIEAQRKEIVEMQWLVDDIEQNGAVSLHDEAEQRPVPKFKVVP